MYTSTAKLTQSGGDLEMQKILHIIGATFKYNPVCTTTAKLTKKIEQTIPYNRTFNILGCIKYDRPNYDLAIYWGTKNKVIGKPVTNYIPMYRTFYVVFFTSYSG